MVERYAYDVYGVPTILAPDGVTPRATSVVGQPFRFTGQRHDAESGLYSTAPVPTIRAAAASCSTTPTATATAWGCTST